MHKHEGQLQQAAGLRLLKEMMMGVRRWLVLALGMALSLATPALAQQSGRIFPYTWATPFDPDEITNADVQHALIWTRNYSSMADGSVGPLTRRATNAWQQSKGYPLTEALTESQVVELMREALKLRDSYGWATLRDDAVGFSVGIPTALSKTGAPTWEHGAWWYHSYGIVQHTVIVLPQEDGCAVMDAYSASMVNQQEGDRVIDYTARKDDWFVNTGTSNGRRFYTRAQCRRGGIVTVIMNFPVQQTDALHFLFIAMANSLNLRPMLSAKATPAPRIEFPMSAPRVATRAATLAPAPVKPALPDVDRTGKAASVKLALSDGSELRAQEVFERVAGAVFVVQTDDRQGSAVAISDRELLTNCHVVAAQTGLYLEREGRRTAVSLVSADVDADRCVLRSGTALLKWVRIRPYSDTRVGERVFTVGAPEGLELSIAEGIVSSKRNLNGYRYLQTTAPISPGSSGGGLFDAQGNLLGITTFMRKDGQNLNFAIPAEEYAR